MVLLAGPVIKFPVALALSLGDPEGLTGG